ncbi:hypothetical protein FQN60_014568 [Etheostoma spectabile]|uniref:Uncharacterized protein n=1 Tax=Etheostoma spectabile TaxID=54343 RepID=A0A5J5DAT6_9PERO|nr:hypothetical protein FQN60_014568 [Etheostoma spectabile]
MRENVLRGPYTQEHYNEQYYSAAAAVMVFPEMALCSSSRRTCGGRMIDDLQLMEHTSYILGPPPFQSHHPLSLRSTETKVECFKCYEAATFCLQKLCRPRFE